MENATAKMSCFARAYHTENHSVHIFADMAARRLLGADYDAIAQSVTEGIGYFLPAFRGSAEEGLRLIVDKQLSPSVLGRSAFCEKTLQNEKRLGCRQYAVFASGYDTFGIRNKDAELSVFELDLPGVLSDKKRRMEAASLKTSAVFVPCDLSDASWKERLIQNGFQCRHKSFVSLLGISYYLPKDAFERLLRGLASVLSEGSALCLDYPSLDEGGETRTNRALAQGAGEQMQALYAPEEMEALLGRCGFPVFEHLDHRAMTERFFSAYNEHCPTHRMEAPKGVCYALAVRK